MLRLGGSGGSEEPRRKQERARHRENVTVGIAAHFWAPAALGEHLNHGRILYFTSLLLCMIRLGRTGGPEKPKRKQETGGPEKPKRKQEWVRHLQNKRRSMSHACTNGRGQENPLGSPVLCPFFGSPLPWLVRAACSDGHKCFMWVHGPISPHAEPLKS